MAEQSFGHEPSGIAVRRIAAVGAVAAVAVIITVTIVCLVLRTRLERARAVNRQAIAAIPPRPRLQAQPRTDLATLRSEKQGALQSWGWADDRGEFARIPIERAMEIYVQQHAATAREANPRAPLGAESRR
jgi:hypothetical protein